MKDEPLVSVVIATYNMGQYLPEAVESVLNQHWKNLEVIVVDDGSEDNTAESISRFNNEPRFRYVRTINQGQPKAKNRGLAESKGEFIGFCDADDLWHPEKLKNQIPHFKNVRVGVVYGDADYIDEHGQVIEKNVPYSRYSGAITNQLIIKNFIPFGTAIIRRECVDKNGIFDESLKMGIDWDLWLRYSTDWEFKYVPQSIYTYRIWHGQMSNNYRGRYHHAFIILRKFLDQNKGEIPPRLIARAWADMYVSRGMSIACAEKTFLEPLRDIVSGLKHDLLFTSGWKSLAKLIIRRV